MKYCYYVRVIVNDSVSVKYVDTFNDVINYVIKRSYHMIEGANPTSFYVNYISIECGINYKNKNTIIERKIVDIKQVCESDDIVKFLYRLVNIQNQFYHQIANIEIENEN